MIAESLQYPGRLRPGGTIELTGPFGGPRRTVQVPEGARVLEIYAVHPGGLTAGIWAQTWFLGAVERPPEPPKRVLWGQNGGSRNVVEAPEVLGRPPGAKFGPKC